MLSLMRLTRFSFLFSFLFISANCNSQIKLKMQTFDIKEFEKHKIAGVYDRVLLNGTTIRQYNYSEGYVQKTISVEGWFYDYKEFYLNGNLKESGTFFKKGDYPAGIWTEYDSSGKMIKETNYDKMFKQTLPSIFEILKQKKIKFTLIDNYNSIRRAVIDSKAIWIVEWKIQQGRIETITIDDEKGKIVNTDFYLLQEQH